MEFMSPDTNAFHTAGVSYKTTTLNQWYIVQELCESRGGRPGLSVLMSLLVSVDVKIYCTVLSALVTNLSLICLMTSEDIKHQFIIITSGTGRPQKFVNMPINTLESGEA